MERIELPLSKMTISQKLDLMEAIWDDLTKEELSLDSPEWHETVLKEREEALLNGSASLSEWEEAKERIRRNVS